MRGKAEEGRNHSRRNWTERPPRTTLNVGQGGGVGGKSVGASFSNKRGGPWGKGGLTGKRYALVGGGYLTKKRKKVSTF